MQITTARNCGEGGGRRVAWLESSGNTASIRIFAMRRHRRANLVCSAQMFFSCLIVDLGEEERLKDWKFRLGGENVGVEGVREKLFWIGNEIKNVRIDWRIEEFES